MTRRLLVTLAFTGSLASVGGCSSEEPAGGSGGGTGGSGLTGGTAGSASGTGGAPGGTAGVASGGTSGTATGGSSGAGAGAGGTTGGDSGSGGAGTGGAAGSSSGAGTGGTAGSGGSGGAGGGGKAGGSGSGGSGGGGAFTITTPAFVNMPGCGPMTMAEMCATIPNEHTGLSGSMNISPAMSWTGAPAGTMSFAIVHQDLSNGMAHWVIWNILARRKHS
jgi:hypothetical protein